MSGVGGRDSTSLTNSFNNTNAGDPAQSLPYESKTLFIKRIPDELNDNILFQDFSAYGRVLATKVYVYPGRRTSTGKLKPGNGSGAFIEFECREAAVHVINSMKEYRGMPVEIKWGQKSLVESLREQMKQPTPQTLGAVRDADQDGQHVAQTYGTVYENDIELKIVEQALHWKRQLDAHYASMSSPQPLVGHSASVGPSLSHPGLDHQRVHLQMYGHQPITDQMANFHVPYAAAYGTFPQQYPMPTVPVEYHHVGYWC
jgi:RNA recognition motif-containing protein